LGDGATQRALRLAKRRERRSGWGRALRKQLLAVFSDRASWRVGKNGLILQKKIIRLAFFVSFLGDAKKKKTKIIFEIKNIFSSQQHTLKLSLRQSVYYDGTEPTYIRMPLNFHRLHLANSLQ